MECNNISLIYLGDLEIVQSLQQFLNKFHFIGSQGDPIQRIKQEELANSSNKVLFFQDVHSYALKIKTALSKWNNYITSMESEKEHDVSYRLEVCEQPSKTATAA